MTAEGIEEDREADGEKQSAETGEVKDPGLTSLRTSALLEAFIGREQEKVSAHPAGREAWQMVAGDLAVMPEDIQGAFKKGAEVLKSKFRDSYTAHAWGKVAQLELTILRALTKAKELSLRIGEAKARLDQESGGSETGPYAGRYDRLNDARRTLVERLESGSWDEVEDLAADADKWQF